MSEAILYALEKYGLKHRGGSKYRCRSPFRDDSDSDSFTYDSALGLGHDKVGNAGYNDRQIAAWLGLPLPDDEQRIPIEDTRRAYTSLKDYATVQGVPVEVFERAMWRETMHNNRPCFAFMTANGERYRFADGGKPKYISPTGYKSCWYGLDKALNMNKGVLVLCNGEASTIVAQYYGVPAFCKTAGEQKLPDYLIEDLQTRGFNGHLWITMDCDDTGRKAAQEIQAQLPGSIIIDLGLTDKGDLANFCKMHSADSLSSLHHKIPTPRPQKPDMVYAHSVAINAIADIEKVDSGYPLVVPFESMHQYGGYAEVLPPGKLCIVLAATGQGKTSWLETWADFWLRQGIGGVWRGDEFSPLEYHYRRVQRYGGINMRRIMSHKLALQEDARNIDERFRKGRRMSPEEIEHYQYISDGLSEWAGKLAYYEGQRETKGLEPMLDIMTREINARRKSGEIVAFAVFDYIQLIRPETQPADKNVPEHALGLIKEWTIDMEIVSLVGSQLTKSASTETRNSRRVDSSDAMQIRLDKANLAVAPKVFYVDDPSGAVDEHNNIRKIPSGEGNVEIVKNSTGGHGDAPVVPDFERLRWVNGIKHRHNTRED